MGMKLLARALIIIVSAFAGAMVAAFWTPERNEKDEHDPY